MSIRKVPNDNTLIELYLNKKYSSGMIASLYNCARTSVCKHIKRLRIVRPESGVNSRNRNFNKKQYRSGYPMTFMPNHPRRNNLGYVFDHILSVEMATGIIPNKQERVHHIDLRRNNPDINNLYLCKNNSEHQKLHGSLNELIKPLLDMNIIIFSNGKYEINNAVSVPIAKMIGERLK